MPHIHEKIDFTVGVYIVHDNKVLLRKHDKYGIWLGVGGHIELDEDPNQAAIREAKEEVGLDIRLLGEKPDREYPGKAIHLIPPRFMNKHFIDKDHQHIDLVYFATCDTKEVHPSGDDISKEWIWFSLDELDNPDYKLSETIKLYAKTALSEIED